MSLVLPLTAPLVLATLLLALHLAGLLEAWLGMRRVTRLDRFKPPRDQDPPSVSVVVAARDEAGGIETALRSLLRQDHERLEWIVVDDRSTDGTSAVLERLAANHGAPDGSTMGTPKESNGGSMSGAGTSAARRLYVERVESVPAGWLGKNNALRTGARSATGDFLLFTDADVVFAPDAIRRAVAYAREHALDHLTAAPRVQARGPGTALLLGSFALLFGRFCRPWKAVDARSAAHVGIGAFNLVRRSVYEAIGGHGPIRMRVDDDLRLGELIKRGGYAQQFVLAPRELHVEWYPSLVAMLRGLTKNAFAALEFRIAMVALVSILLIALFAVPPILALTGTGATRAVAISTWILMAAGFASASRTADQPRLRTYLLAPAVPAGVLLYLMVLWASTLSALVNRGVTWRGTHYPLDELRAHASGSKA